MCYFHLSRCLSTVLNSSPGLFLLPLGLLRLLKPCNVKRFLATEDLSLVGLVTGSSGNDSLKWEAGGREKRVLNGNINVAQKRKEKNREKE